jgi:hypothetical protein
MVLRRESAAVAVSASVLDMCWRRFSGEGARPLRCGSAESLYGEGVLTGIAG